MNTFALFFRMNLLNPDLQPSPTQMQVYMSDWNEWISTLSKNGRLSGGNHLSREGVLLQKDQGNQHLPHEANGQSLAGFLLILAYSFDEAAQLAHACPVLNGHGTSVEVRQIM